MTNTVKLNLASFDYYLLKINPNIELEKIDIKLANLRQMDQFGKYIVIEFEAQSTLDNLVKLIAQIKLITKKHGFEVKFVKSNKFATIGSIGDTPVTDLMTNLKSKEIINNTLKVVDPIRSGIKVENDGDIIVLNLVSNNAEVIAGGNIHVYGDARGRLIAGNNGDKSARIFAFRFNAELISIAGIYKVLEEQLPANLHNKAVQIFLDEKERLNILPL